MPRPAPASHPSPPKADLRRGPWALALLAVLAVGLYLRFDGLGQPSLWLDEILHYEKTLATQHEPWHAWITGVAADRENGSLFYASQLLALRLFDDEFAVRLMPALAGLATLGVVWLIALTVTGSKQVAVVAAALLAVSPLHVYYSREGRPYAAVMLMATLLLLLALEHRRPWTRVAIYGLALATAYLGAMAAPVLLAGGGLAALEWLRTRHYGHFVKAACAGLVASLLLFPTVEQLGLALGTGANAATLNVTNPLSATAFDRLLASFSVSGVDRGTSNGLSFLFLSLALWGGLCLARRDSHQAVWVVGMFVLPVVGWMTLLVIFGHWYNVRYTSVGLPAFLILVAIGLVDWWQRLRYRLGQLVGRRAPDGRFSWVPGTLGGTLGRALGRALGDMVGTVLLLLLLAPLWRSARLEPLQKPDWRGIAALIGSLAATDEPVIARGGWAETCIRHYLRQLHLPVEVFSANHDLALAKELTARYPRAWVLAAGYWRTAEFNAWMKTLDPVLSSRLGKIELVFYPDFRSLLVLPERFGDLRSPPLGSAAAATRQEFAPSELLLGAGWFAAESSPDGTSFRWAKAGRAELALLAPPQAGPRLLRMRLRPFPSPARPPQSIAVSINSQPLATVTLQAGWNEISLPPFTGHPVADLVTFDFAWSQSPHEANPTTADPRQLTAAFDFVESVSAVATNL